MCGVFVLGPCTSDVALGTVSVFGNDLAEEENAGCFICNVVWLFVFYVSSSRCTGLVCSL